MFSAIDECPVGNRHMKSRFVIFGIFVGIVSATSLVVCGCVSCFRGTAHEDIRSVFVSESDNLEYGIPSCTESNEIVVINRKGYAVGFDMRHRQPRWVSYRLTRKEVLDGINARRSDDFREDPLLPPGTVTLDDYRRSGYDRGHIAPAADMGWDAQAMSESFYLSNMSPQNPDFNRGIWMHLESWVRKEAVKHGSVVVVSGCIFGNSTNRIGRSGVTVPEGYFKAVLDDSTPVNAIGFLLQNKGSRKPVMAFACTVDSVELVTGLDLFPLLEPAIQSNAEAVVRLDHWIGGR